MVPSASRRRLKDPASIQLCNMPCVPSLLDEIRGFTR